MFDGTLCPYLSGCLLVLVDRRRFTSALFALSSFALTRGVAGFRLLKLSAKSSVSSELYVGFRNSFKIRHISLHNMSVFILSSNNRFVSVHYYIGCLIKVRR